MKLDLDKNARVWIYQSSRFLREEEVLTLQQRLTDFLESWSSHGSQLWADGRILHRLFLVLAVDENKAHASGCSIDQSVHFVKAVGNHLNVDFFGRQVFAYQEADKILLIGSNDVVDAYKKGSIDDGTLFYDNLVNNVDDFETKWLKPLKESWHYRFVS